MNKLKPGGRNGQEEIAIGKYLEDDLTLAALRGATVKELNHTAGGYVGGAAQDEHVLDATGLGEQWASRVVTASKAGK